MMRSFPSSFDGVFACSFGAAGAVVPESDAATLKLETAKKFRREKPGADSEEAFMVRGGRRFVSEFNRTRSRGKAKARLSLIVERRYQRSRLLAGNNSVESRMDANERQYNRAMPRRMER